MKVISYPDLNRFIKAIKLIVKILNQWKKLSLSFGVFRPIGTILVFRKIKPNPFLIIEKATLTFQNLHKFINDTYLNNEGCNVPRKVEKWILWIPPINGRFKLNFDCSRINNISASGWVNRDSNGIIQMAGSRHLGNALIIIALRYGVLTAVYYEFSNLEIERDSKVIIDC